MSESPFPGCSRAPLTHRQLAQSTHHRSGNLSCKRTAVSETPAFAAPLQFNPHRLSQAA